MMTKAECDELDADLTEIGVEVREVRRSLVALGDWEIVIWSEYTKSLHTIVSARMFREAVHEGLTSVLPKGALDKKDEG